MERITTNRSVYFNEIKKELLNTSSLKNRELVFTYCEIGQLLTHGFSISFLVGENSCLHIKKWNAEYDNERFKLGIFNLDRLALTKYEKELNNNDLLKIKSLSKSHLNINKHDTVILDGFYSELIFDKFTLRWNIKEEMNLALSELICFIKNKAEP